MPTIASRSGATTSPATGLAVPTTAEADRALQDARRVWERTLPIWASDCLILQARGLRDPKWTPFATPDLWNVDVHDDDDVAAVRAAA